MALKKAESTAVSEKWALDHTTDKLISAGELCEAWSWADRGHGAGERGIGRAGRGLQYTVLLSLLPSLQPLRCAVIKEIIYNNGKK